MNKKLTLAIACVLLCSGCVSGAPGVSPTPTGTVAPPVSESPIVTVEPTTTPQKVVFPPPTRELFGLDGNDAVLYEAVVDFYFGRGGDSHLLLPSLSILDSYTDTDGNTDYICWFWQFDYYELANGLNDLQSPKYTLSSGKVLARITVADSPNAGVTCTDIMEIGDGEGMMASIDIICGPKKELAEAIKNDSTLPVDVQDLTPTDPVEMLNDYLDYYFRT